MARYSQQTLEAMEKDKPSKEPSYWAKKSCKLCHGTGTTGKLTRIIGNNNKIINEQICYCVKKAFSEWQETWLEEHSPSPKKNEDPAPRDISVSALSPDTYQKSVYEERLDRIDRLCCPLREEIKTLKQRRDEIPKEHNLKELEEKVLSARGDVTLADVQLSTLQKEAENLEGQADELYTQVKLLRSQAERMRTTDKATLQEALVRCEEELKTRESFMESVKNAISRETHKFQKKIRELEDKLDHLEDRRHKILKEHGLLADAIDITEETVIPE
jgi:hypothetical protein